jgi:hypothetical protein
VCTFFGIGTAGAQEPAGQFTAPREPAEEQQALVDLTPLNFFTDGWTEPWVHRHRKTPDMSLLRVTTNFLEREFRVDYTFQKVNNNPKIANQQMLQGLIAYGLDRRIMLEVITNYTWFVSPSGAPPVNGPDGAGLVRFQLVDTATASYDIQYRIAGPNPTLGITATSMQYALAGWHDLGAALPALGRFGLYDSLQYENFVGSPKPGTTTSDLTYVVSFAETWTPADMLGFGNFTTFAELAGVTKFDGTTAGTTISITPGLRFWFLPKNSFTAGVDLPLTNNAAYSYVFRANYILNF